MIGVSLTVFSVVVCSLGSFPVFCKGDVYFIKMTMARQQIGSLSGNWDEEEPCRGISKQQRFLRGRKGTESQKCITWVMRTRGIVCRRTQIQISQIKKSLLTNHDNSVGLFATEETTGNYCTSQQNGENELTWTYLKGHRNICSQVILLNWHHPIQFLYLHF